MPLSNEVDIIEKKVSFIINFKCKNTSLSKIIKIKKLLTKFHHSGKFSPYSYFFIDSNNSILWKNALFLFYTCNVP